MPDGGAALIGSFAGTAVFGDGDRQDVLISGGTSDIFLAKYASDGALAWAKQVKNPVEGFFGADIASLADGGLFVTGTFSSAAAVFRPGEIAETVLNAGGVYVAQYDPNGTLGWARQIPLPSGFGLNALWSVATLPDGNAVIAGDAPGSAIFASRPRGAELKLVEGERSRD